MRRQVVDSKRDSICETQSVQNQVWRQEEQLSWVIMACCSLVQCSRRARHAAWARLAEAAGYQAAAQWFQMARTRQKKVCPKWFHEFLQASFSKILITSVSGLPKVISRVFTSKFQQILITSVSGLLTLHIQNLSNRCMHKYNPPTFTIFFVNLIYGGILTVGPSVGPKRGGCCRSNCEAHCQSQSKKATLHLIEKRSRLTLSYWLSCKITILSAS